MIEVEVGANQLHIELPASLGQRVRGAEKTGQRKVYMLPDLEAMPHTHSVYACTKLLDIVSLERAQRNAAARFGTTRTPRRPIRSRGGKK